MKPRKQRKPIFSCGWNQVERSQGLPIQNKKIAPTWKWMTLGLAAKANTRRTSLCIACVLVRMALQAPPRDHASHTSHLAWVLTRCSHPRPTSSHFALAEGERRNESWMNEKLKDRMLSVSAISAILWRELHWATPVNKGKRAPQPPQLCAKCLRLCISVW